jgi:riboflavin kinase/FMN adenylyltransferase
VLAIGNFDGVHLGHVALVKRLAEVAACSQLAPTVLTFEPHPREFFAPASAPARLTTLREKLELLGESGARQAMICPFNARFAALSADEFIEQVLVRGCQVRHLIIGDDFRFGRGRTGDFTLLQDAGRRFGFAVEAMSSVMVDGERVSSSAIRQALVAGNMAHAARLLGRPYIIDGQVSHGQKLGRQIGFATANLRIKHNPLPMSGVFAVEVSGLGANHYPASPTLAFGRPWAEPGRYWKYISSTSSAISMARTSQCVSSINCATNNGFPILMPSRRRLQQMLRLPGLFRAVSTQNG